MKANILYPRLTSTTALVVGHNSKDKGAINFLGEYEYDFNLRIAKKVRELINIPVVLRPPIKSYSKQVRAVADACLKLNVKHTIHLHFNSFNKRSQGVEVLIRNTDNYIDNEIAEFFVSEINKHFGIQSRGVKEISSGHSGYKMLDTISAVGILSMIVEPVFGDSKSSKDFFMIEDKYVNILCETINRYGLHR